MIERIPFEHLLKKVIDNRGKTCPTSDHGIPLIATNCVKNSTLYPSFEKIRYVGEEAYANWFRGHPQPGDIIFVTKGSPGQLCLAPSPVNFCIAQDMVAARANPDLIYPPYLFAALRSEIVQNDIANMHVGTMIPHFKKGDFDKLKIPVPDPDVQKFTGDMYLEFSKKIDLNRRMNETLEAIVRAIFKDWFVDFGPTRAKMKGRAPYLSPDDWSLFPDRLDDEGKPKGWFSGEIGDLCSRIAMGPFGSDITTDNFVESGVPVVRGMNLREGFVEDQFAFITEAKADTLKNANAFPRDIVVTHRGTLGQVGLIPPCSRFPRYVISQSQMLLRANGTSATPHFLFEFLRSAIGQERLLANTSQTGVPAIARPTTSLRSIRIVISPFPLVARFDLTAESLAGRTEANHAENRTLAATRDLLLPKLMSGEIRIKDAEKVLEKVL